MREKIDEKVENFKKRLGWKFYILLVATYGVAGFLLEKIMPIMKEYIFQLDFQPLIKSLIYYTGLGYLMSILVPLATVIVVYVYFALAQ